MVIAFQGFRQSSTRVWLDYTRQHNTTPHTVGCMGARDVKDQIKTSLTTDPFICSCYTLLLLTEVTT